jgi:hypothetical protein
MLSVENKPIMPSVIMLNVVMLSVVAPKFSSSSHNGMTNLYLECPLSIGCIFKFSL